MNIVGWIRVGDQAACGGTVAEGDPAFSSNGQAFSFQGAQMSCPGNCVISEGFPGSTISNARQRVLHGMKTSGGCPLLSTMNDRDGISNASEETLPIRFVRTEAGEWVGKANEGYDQHFVLRDQQTGQPLSSRHYRLTFNGKTIEGKTDTDGRTERVVADDPSEVTIEIMPEAYVGVSK
jgi:uncharacterized Zn-binding protein involved in type VI secretion